MSRHKGHRNHLVLTLLIIVAVERISCFRDGGPIGELLTVRVGEFTAEVWRGLD